MHITRVSICGNGKPWKCQDLAAFTLIITILQHGLVLLDIYRTAVSLLPVL